MDVRRSIWRPMSQIENNKLSFFRALALPPTRSFYRMESCIVEGFLPRGILITSSATDSHPLPLFIIISITVVLTLQSFISCTRTRVSFDSNKYPNLTPHDLQPIGYCPPSEFIVVFRFRFHATTTTTSRKIANFWKV